MAEPPSIYQMSGGPNLTQKYLLGPHDDKVHRMQFDLEAEANMILRRASVKNPIRAFLKDHYVIVKVENTGSPLPFFAAVYDIEIWINRASIVDNHPAMGTLVGFERLLDKSASGTLLPWHCHIYNFGGEGHKIKTIHGSGARVLSTSLAMNRSHGRF